MRILALVTCLALVEYMWIGFLVGQARGRYGIKAPATSGNEVFERYFRVHQNTLEQLVIFLPGLWVFGSFVSAAVAGALGLVFIAGRFVYLRSYVANPDQRGLGFLLTFAPNAVLVLGGLVGAALAWLRS
ncbi:MAG TPA: MAPEG family protein [Myxococcota bacterium]|nr:MAPEG family protein [Myxococcota bacterium]